MRNSLRDFVDVFRAAAVQFSATGASFSGSSDRLQHLLRCDTAFARDRCNVRLYFRHRERRFARARHDRPDRTPILRSRVGEHPIGRAVSRRVGRRRLDRADLVGEKRVRRGVIWPRPLARPAQPALHLRDSHCGRARAAAQPRVDRRHGRSARDHVHRTVHRARVPAVRPPDRIVFVLVRVRASCSRS